MGDGLIGKTSGSCPAVKGSSPFHPLVLLQLHLNSSNLGMIIVNIEWV